MSAAVESVKRMAENQENIATGNETKAPVKAASRAHRSQKVGTVASDKMQKTVIVRVDRSVKHTKYRRYVRRTSKFMVKPASEGTGVIAGGAVRAVMQAVGVRDVRTKVLGSTNPHNVVRATFDALLRMKDPMELARLRGKQVEEM